MVTTLGAREPLIGSPWIDSTGRGRVPCEWFFAPEKDGMADGNSAYLQAQAAARVAYILGFDVQELPPEVAGGYGLRITQPERRP